MYTWCELFCFKTRELRESTNRGGFELMPETQNMASITSYADRAVVSSEFTKFEISMVGTPSINERRSYRKL
jgi:hypothetical protein